jgi:hypothetical protein
MKSGRAMASQRSTAPFSEISASAIEIRRSVEESLERSRFEAEAEACDRDRSSCHGA